MPQATLNQTPPPGPLIRRADPADGPAMAACARAAYEDYIPLIGRPPAPMEEDYEKVAADDVAFVALVHGRVVGLMVLKLKEGRAVLDNLAVRPEAQGQGLGRRLIDLAESEAGAAGFKTLELYTNQAMTKNISLYSRLGFSETGRRTEDGFRRVYMSKRLSGLPPTVRQAPAAGPGSGL